MSGRITIRVPDVAEVEESSSSESFTMFKRPAVPKPRPPKEPGNSSSASTSVQLESTNVQSRLTDAQPQLTSIRSQSTTIVQSSISSSTEPKSIENDLPIEEPPPKQAHYFSGNCVVVSPRQRGNPVLRLVRNVPYEYGEIVGDYQLGSSCMALFLSLKFHKLHSDYIHERMKQVGHSYAHQVLLVQVDVQEPEQTLRELNSICFNANWTLILAWTVEEIAEYIESFKIFENKPPDFLMTKQETDPRSRLIDLLSSIRSITRTDAENLLATFGSLAEMLAADEERLALCPGLGPKKAKRLHEAFGAKWRDEQNVDDKTEIELFEED